MVALGILILAAYHKNKFVPILFPFAMNLEKKKKPKTAQFDKRKNSTSTNKVIPKEQLKKKKKIFLTKYFLKMRGGLRLLQISTSDRIFGFYSPCNYCMQL